MGIEHSKPKTSSCKRLSFKLVNGALIFANGDKYIGDIKDGELTGNGTYYYSNGDVYKGEWCCNKKCGFGIQIYAKDNNKYVGFWQDNLPHGDGTFYYTDGSYFVGSFLEGEKHGDGVFYDAQNDGYEEEWVNGKLIRRAPTSAMKEQRPPSSRTASTLNKKRSKADLEEENNSDNNDECEIKSQPKTEGNENNSGSEDEEFEDRKNNKKSARQEKDFEKQLHSNILFKSQNDFDSCDIKTYEVGLETLNIIEHMDMLNSVAGTLLNKDVHNWTYADVGSWLKHLGLSDYIDIFQKNHINGEVLFEITEADLKDEFGMTSVGHRKNFIKALENLKKIYCSDAGKNSEYVRHKIEKFYNKNRPTPGKHLFNAIRPREGRFYSHRLASLYHSQHEIIEETEEFMKNEPNPSPQIVAKKGAVEGKEDFKLVDQINKAASPKPNKPMWDATEYKSHPKSIEDCEEAKEMGKVNLSKKTLSKVSSDSQKSSPAKEDNEPKQFGEAVEELKSQHSKKEEKNSSNTSLSDTTSESEPSDDEKMKKDGDEKPKEESMGAIAAALKLRKGQSRYEKRTFKRNLSGNSQNFKSAELPASSRNLSKTFAEKRAGTTQPHDKNTLNKKIKDEILRIFRESGLNENFIIDYNELSFEKKIGEGGYGRVFLGKFSGIDVAIKEYGKTKLDIRRAEDFVKEVEVISNLRHPNIVLCMGACIHNGKYLMITEYLEEGSLFDHLHKKHTKINDETMFNIVEDIALGMCYLHGRKVFHCDLKSSNILIDSNWSVKLCDFGLSRVKYKSDRKRFQKQRVGTPHWMAPEILRGEKYDEAADVYSFGMILWELVTGEIPYHNMAISDIIATVGYKGEQVNLPTKGNPLILSIIKHCLSLNIQERPTFKQIVDQLQQRAKSILGANKKNNMFTVFGS